ncbi:MAG: NitT/TauT family transport system substrate-binding protein [Solirubrobacteraceae bacterium]|nr:NitT/TauT family transport system substrate-binding protein [Solirubrobacteraceae bacterium]
MNEHPRPVDPRPGGTSPRPRRRPSRAAFALLASLLLISGVLAACGGDGGGGSGGSGSSGSASEEVKPATLNVGVIPIADVAPLYVGIKQGFFKEQQLTINPKLAEGGAAITPAVLSGDFQIGFSNTISLLIASSKGLPVEVITQGVLGGKDESEAWADLMVLKNGSVRTPKDLEGKTIAVNTLKNICEVTIKASLAKKGVDINTLKFIEVPFPDMNAAIEAKRVDGACVVEPFVSQGKAGKARGIDPFYVGTAPDLTVATYFTSKQYAEKNKGVVDRFITAMNKSLDYSQQNPDAVRAVLADYTKIPPEAAKNIKLPVWRSELTTDTIQQLSKLSKEYGLIEKEPDLGQLIRPGS